MTNAQIQKITERAKQDKAFFHALIFEPDRARELFAEIDPKLKNISLDINPAKVFSALLSTRAARCDENYTSSGPCGGTCGGRTCNITCAGDSCGRTCDDSCGNTTFLSPLMRNFF